VGLSSKIVTLFLALCTRRQAESRQQFVSRQAEQAQMERTEKGHAQDHSMMHSASEPTTRPMPLDLLDRNHIMVGARSSAKYIMCTHIYISCSSAQAQMPGRPYRDGCVQVLQLLTQHLVLAGVKRLQGLPDCNTHTSLLLTTCTMLHLRSPPATAGAS